MSTMELTSASATQTMVESRPIIESLSLRGACTDEGIFDARKHLAPREPTPVVKMTDIGLAEDTGISPVAVSQPFHLFTEEAVQRMRSEIFKPEVMEKCRFSSNIAPCQLRGFSSKYAPFVHAAWNNPETLRTISEIAGVDLVPCMDYEVAHINISVKSAEQAEEERAKFEEEQSAPEAQQPKAAQDVVGWHTDAYPFVCVLMLSDCTSMVGGETALRTGNGDIMKVRGPGMGCGVVLQGRYIYHKALPALGSQERITLVTSFRPRNPHLPDDSCLSTVRSVSDLSELYYEFSEYRLEMLEERIRDELKKIRNSRRTGTKFGTDAFKSFLKIQRDFINHTDNEMLEDSKVRAGWIEETKFDDETVA